MCYLFTCSALTVNLTTMLVMTTIFISKMDGLPPTSAIKMIDIWLIMCQLVPFCEVVLLTAIEYTSGGEQGANGEKTKTINHHGKMRVIKLDDSSKEANNGGMNEKPEKAWSPSENGGCEFYFLYFYFFFTFIFTYRQHIGMLHYLGSKPQIDS